MKLFGCGGSVTPKAHIERAGRLSIAEARSSSALSRAVRPLLLPLVLIASVGIPQATDAAERTVDVSQLMSSQPLPDIWVGKDDAPITIVEYASMTCTHCAAFHADVWPALKAKYIDTGHVRFVLREFPLDPLSTAAFMLGRCAGAEKRDAVLDLLFTKQNDWAFTDKPVTALEETAKQAGIAHDAFQGCLKDQALYSSINAERDRAASAFAVDSTPVFFVNGVKHVGSPSMDDLERMM